MKVIVMPNFRINEDGRLVVEGGAFDFADEGIMTRGANEVIDEWVRYEANKRLAAYPYLSKPRRRWWCR